MENACVIGWGTVGKATGGAFGIKNYYSRSEENITLWEAAKLRYIFICLPTPTINGINTTKDIYETIDTIIKASANEHVFIIRSTVFPGFAQTIHHSLGVVVVSNPEFLSEDTAIDDALNPDLIVIGSDNPGYAREVEALYVGRFKYKEIIITDSITAELIKYTLNSFFSTKVIFGNEIYDYAQKIGANYHTIKKVLESHKWGSKNHFRPWYKEKRGIHGKCLPKDLEAFATQTKSELFKVLLEINERIKNA